MLICAIYAIGIYAQGILSIAISSEGNSLLYLSAKFVIILISEDFLISVTGSGGYYSIHLYLSFSDTALCLANPC